jgi:outer membrane protein OmpA-like peptidoglycan-associated protein
MSSRLLVAAVALAISAGHALAQGVKLYGAAESVDPRDVAQILDRSAARPAAMKMRSIRLLDESTSAQVAQPERSSSKARPSALALPVQFAFDSADIQPAARHQLDALAEGIRLLPEVQSVVIEGHTDATGSDRYNEQLSQRRAYSVKRYLVAAHGIAPERLRAVGLGSFATLPGRDPYAADNRRVQFRGE